MDKDHLFTISSIRANRRLLRRISVLIFCIGISIVISSYFLTSLSYANRGLVGILVLVLFITCVTILFSMKKVFTFLIEKRIIREQIKILKKMKQTSGEDRSVFEEAIKDLEKSLC